jgi:Sec-independent protein translocase protein TatA
MNNVVDFPKKKRGKPPREARQAAQSVGSWRRRLREKRQQAVLEREEARRQGKQAVAPPAADDHLPHVAHKEAVAAPDGSRPVVAVRGFTMHGLQAQYQGAARRFGRDYELVHRKLRCRGFEPGVDGGSNTGAHLESIEAQARIKQLQKFIGEEDFTILLAVVILGYGPAKLHRLGGPDHRTISYEIRRILRNVLEFYSNKRVGPDPLLRAAFRLVEEAQLEVDRN